MKKNFKIIKANLSHLDKFYKLFQKTLRQSYFLYPPNSSDFIIEQDMTKGNIKRGLEEKSYILYLGISDSRVVGYLLARKINGGVAFAHWLGVAKDFQNKGVASNLLAFWEKEAFAQGSHKLQLWTTENNIKFYKNRGFTLGGEFPDAWYGVDHFLFYKTLRKSNEKNFLKEYLESLKKK